MRFVRIGVVSLLLMGAIPFAVSAQTTQQMEQQIAQLLAQLNALQALLGTAPASQLPGTGFPSPLLDGSMPLALPRDLNTGDRGQDVSLLQRYLARDPQIYPEALVTGNYFGLTTSAVRRFQIACGIASAGDEYSTGFGRVGPRTRNALQFGCPGRTATTPNTFNAGTIVYNPPPPYQQPSPPPPNPSGTPQGPVYPTSGPVPLSVTVQATFTTLACSVASTTYRTYRLNYGDGEFQDVYYKVRGVIDPECGRQVTRPGSHTYRAAGSYTIKLEEIGPDVYDNATVLNSFFVAYVTAGGSGSGSTLPPGIQVRLDGNPTEIARGNTLSISWNAVNVPTNSAVRLELHRESDGSPVGEAGIVNELPVNGSYAWQVPPYVTNGVCQSGTGMLCGNHITENSRYRVRAFLYEPRGACWGSNSCYGGNLASSRAIGNTESFTILPYGAIAGSSFTAVPESGAAPLAVAFTIQANQGGACTAGNYSIDFGDGSARQDIAIGTVCGTHVLAVSHTYTSGGTWTAKFYTVPSSAVTSNTTPNATRVVTVSGTTTQASLLLKANLSGTAFTDESGHHTFTIEGNAAAETTADRWNGASVRLDGSGDYLTVSDGADLDLGIANEPFAIETWVYRISGNTGVVFTRGGGAAGWNTTNGAMYGLFFENGFTYLSVNVNGAPSSVFATELPTANAWVHLAGTFDGSTLRLFMNGVQKGAVGISGTMTAPSTRNATRIGRFISAPGSLAIRSCPAGYTMANNVCVTAPAQCSIYFEPAAIVQGGSATLYWSGPAAGTLSYSGGSNAVAASGSGSTGGQGGSSSTYTFTSGATSCSATLAICAAGQACNDYNGFLNALRVTKGQARWTSNFTPPTY